MDGRTWRPDKAPKELRGAREAKRQASRPNAMSVRDWVEENCPLSRTGRRAIPRRVSNDLVNLGVVDYGFVGEIIEDDLSAAPLLGPSRPSAISNRCGKA